MNKELVVKLLQKKTHHFLTISLIIMVVSLSIINFMFSYLINQSYMINKDYLTNNNVKVIQVNGKSENDFPTSIEVDDEKKINDLLATNGLVGKAEAYPIFNLSFGLESTLDDNQFFLTGLSKELAFLISDTCTLKDKSICVIKSKDEHIDIKLPVINQKDGGYSSSEVIKVTYVIEQGAKNENAIFINSVPYHRAYVNENEFNSILKQMFQHSTDSFEFTQNSQLDKVIVYVEDIKDVDAVGELLKENNYFTSYTFNSFENFSANISSLHIMLLVLSIIFVIASIITAVLLMVNFLRIQRKEIAILKLSGYDSKSIVRIYTKLISSMLQRIFIISFLIYLINYVFKLVPISFEYLLVVIGVDIMILLLTLAFVYFFGVKKICNMDTIDLLKKGKEFE